VVVNTGETIFLPPGWWHQVTALGLSLYLSFSNPAVPHTFSDRNPDIRNW
jgi:quercetin dioxygenase-like cupin family protein